MAKTNINSLQVSDIVSIETIMTVAKMVRKKAAQIAKANRAPLAPGRSSNNKYSASNIGITTPRTTRAQIEIGLTLSEVAMAYEHGSGVHAGKGKYPILPKRKKMLHFKWEVADANPDKFMFDRYGNVMLPKVSHPGVAAKPFLAPAKRATRKERNKIISREAGKNIRTIIRGMARVVK